MDNQFTYKDDIKPFKQILSSEAEALLSTESLAVVYIGKESCPYSRKFVKTLNKLVDNLNTNIYYIDSEASNIDVIKSFREKYSVKTLPGFIVGKNGKANVLCNSSATPDTLIEMLK